MKPEISNLSVKNGKHIHYFLKYLKSLSSLSNTQCKRLFPFYGISKILEASSDKYVGSSNSHQNES